MNDKRLETSFCFDEVLQNIKHRVWNLLSRLSLY